MRYPAALLALLLLPVPALAGGELQAESAHLSDGRTLDGQLAAFVRTGEDARFRLTADVLRVETDERDADLGVVASETHTSGRDHHRAELEGTGAGTGARMYVVSTGPARVTPADPSCMVLEAPVVPAAAYQPRLDGRPALESSLADAVAAAPCHDTALSITGDLLVALWEWDADLRSDAGETTVASGRGDAGSGDAGAREVFVLARDATLVVPADGNLYLRNVTATAGDVHLAAASGNLDGVIVDGDLDVRGGVLLDVHGRGAGRPLAVRVGGDWSTLHLESQPLVVTTPQGVGAWPWLLAVGLLVLGTVAYYRPHWHYRVAERRQADLGSLVPQTRSQRRGVGLWLMAQAAERRGWWRLSFWRARRATDLFRPFAEAQFMRAVAAGELGLHADAMTDFLDLYNRMEDPMGRAAAAVGVAKQCVRLERWATGKHWLLLASGSSFTYAHHASLDSDFDGYVGQPWFDALRRGTSSTPTDPSVH